MKTSLILLLSLLSLCRVEAGDSEGSFTYDLTQTVQSQTLPVWMTGPPTASPALHATISFPITPPPGNSDLAVTFFFTETMGGFLRVYWAGAQASAMLGDNLFEGIAMPNQRTLLIRRATLSFPGTLTVQSSETTLNVSRIHWEWMDPGTLSLAGNAKASALITASGNVLKDGEVSGAPSFPQTDQVGKSVVTAILADKPVRIETGVEFEAPLQTLPLYARVEVQVSGAPVDWDSYPRWHGGDAPCQRK